MKMEHYEMSTSFYNPKRSRKHKSDFAVRIQEIKSLLPGPEEEHPQKVTKKETLIHLLKYLEFLQLHIEVLQTELAPLNLQEVLEKTYDRLEKIECINLPEGSSSCILNEMAVKEEERCFQKDCYSTSPELNIGDPSITSIQIPYNAGVLLKDCKLGEYFSSEEFSDKSCNMNSLLQQETGNSTCTNSLNAVAFQDELKLSPSLLSSPSREQTHVFKRQDSLQDLFEDVLIGPEHTDDQNLESSKIKVEEEECDSCNWIVSKKEVSQSRSNSLGDPASLHMKKNFLNGFVTFCQLKRKEYVRSHPGMPFAVVTKELADLWLKMPKRQKKMYCSKARQLNHHQYDHTRDVSK
ncbi:uncharacterized protein LOC120539742 [Polypterus senegalus]|uniref:uncharacterized protein LOC120539742 n=1 Tax=Polypterus senegalus TaxID=55291 RepID=UPI001965A9AD|nr:uncharacterized protein LOC120539742 [Polypterus senegalus]XP_039626059.1 uncharacterized protein LOC120539742 [Polypterus senegalus]XP_039626060.1 uncharacterized protein LOC120539742 [Polypterus senegalus]